MGIYTFATSVTESGAGERERFSEVSSSHLPDALEIAFEILACGNSHVQIGDAHLASHFNSQTVGRGYQISNLKRHNDQFTSRMHEGRTHLCPSRSLHHSLPEQLLNQLMGN